MASALPRRPRLVAPARQHVEPQSAVAGYGRIAREQAVVPFAVARRDEPRVDHTQAHVVRVAGTERSYGVDDATAARADGDGLFDARAVAAGAHRRLLVCLRSQYFYTADGAESFGFLYDDALASSPALSPEAAESRLREDFVYLWRSKLYADVQLEIDVASVVAPAEPVYFTVHRAILCSRSPYFAALMLAPYADRDARLLRLPASAGFTASSLHFILGALCSLLDLLS